MRNSIVGCLLGTAVGDALGLCCEGMSARRQHRMFPQLENYHMLLAKGMCSDDTEHACTTAQALTVSAGEPRAFVRTLAWRFRFWLLGLPSGMGRATMRSVVKLWFCFSGERSGVFSAGNGPAMRSSILGVCYGHDEEKLRQLVRASTRMTHTDPKAEYGALAVALAAHESSIKKAEISSSEFLARAEKMLGPEAEELLVLIRKACASAAAKQSTADFVAELGLGHGVSGYIYDTVPVALQAWLLHPHDFRAAVLAVIHCGGDTDTTAAIVGGIVGAGVGKPGISQAWLDGLCEWPRTVTWMERLGQRLADVLASGIPQSALFVSPLFVLVRNLFFLVVVLLHVVRRCLPPY